ncbi:MAG: TonB-dependent receptor plug domain-containing protein [Paraglaciecola sp.]|uniref:TonB-dependent receptor n=1 Tax=Paraglaciecola sp. TaxID=1920173 RepID=UPI0032996042
MHIQLKKNTLLDQAHKSFKLTALTLLTIASPLALSEQKPTNEEDIESIEVLGSKENSVIFDLQDEAVSATSISEDSLRILGSGSRADMLRTVPGLAVMDMGTYTNIVIRGTSTAPDGDPNGSATAVYFDDVSMSGVSGSTDNVEFEAYDIQRIDILRGPQGTSYGAGASAGAIRYVTATPDLSQFSGKVAATFKDTQYADESGYDADGHLNIPLIKNELGVRFTAYSRLDPNPIYGTSIGAFGESDKVSGGRIAATYIPNEDISFNFRYIYEDITDASLTRTVRSLGNYITSESPRFTESEAQMLYGNIDWDLGFANVVIVTSKTDADSYSASTSSWAGDVITGDSISNVGNGETDSTTFEVRLSDVDEQGIDWVIGAYYENRDYVSTGSYINNVTNQVALTEWDFDGVDDPDSDNVAGSIWSTTEDQKAIFGELSYWFDSSISVTLGLRRSEFTAADAWTRLYEGDSTSASSLDYYPTFPDTSTFQPRLAVTYKPEQGELYYAQYAEIERPGGNNWGALDDSCPTEYRERVNDTYKGDKIQTLEGGAKFSKYKGVTFNTSVFYSLWHDAPTYTGIPCDTGAQFYIDNAEELTLYGLEADLYAELSSGFSTSASFSWTETEITSIYYGYSGGLKGDSTPASPGLKASMTLTWTGTVFNDMQLDTNLIASYTGSYKNGLSVDWSTWVPGLTIPGYDIEVIGEHPSGLDIYNDPGAGDYTLMSASVALSKDNWSVRAFADNLLGADDVTTINYLNSSPEGEATFSLVTPRTVGIRAEFYF